MIERRPLGVLLAHFILILGILIVAFPIYYTFVASTLTTPEIMAPPMPLVPGPHFLENYGGAFGGIGTIGGVGVGQGPGGVHVQEGVHGVVGPARDDDAVGLPDRGSDVLLRARDLAVELGGADQVDRLS